mmetsp:Transcript_134750/g.336265  ORF Transcript_134750/g.336265 Transcript_134750/m.336265 type:complete len:218 (-) Transcript_134750:432-1085(-)
MSSAAVLLLAKEVAALKDIPAGPARAAACSRPRRRSWDVLASIQRSLRLLGPVATEGWQRGQAQEALDCCDELRDVLRMLQDFELASGNSHWAATEYDVLFQEVELQVAQARTVLGEDVATAADEIALFTEGASPASMEMRCSSMQSLGAVSTCPSTGSHAAQQKQQQQQEDAALKPVRLTTEELQEEYPHCEWALNGTCQAGCTVGGCRLDLVEAW